MRDPLLRSNFQSRGTGFSSFSTTMGKGEHSSSHQGKTGKKKKSDFCWNFNKGVVCKYGKKCHFIEHCSYCDRASHGVYQCPKLDKKEVTSTGGSPAQ